MVRSFEQSKSDTPFFDLVLDRTDPEVKLMFTSLYTPALQ